MKIEINTNEAAHMLLQDENANWSYNGALALAEWYEEWQEECGFERCVVAIRCDFSEYKTALECIEDNGYDCDLSECEDDEKEDFCMDYLNEYTFVIEFDGGIIVQAF